MENGNSNDVNKKSLVILIVLLFLLVLLVIGLSYQVYLYTETGSSVINKIFGDSDEDIFKNGTVTLVYNEGTTDVRIENAMPLSDSEGMNLSKKDQLMDFTVSINIAKSSRVSYEVVAEKDPSSTIPDKYIKIYLERSLDSSNYEEKIIMPTVYKGLEKDDDYGASKGSMVLDQATTSSSVVYYYRLRMWLSKDYVLDEVDRFFTIRINVYAKGEKMKK